MEINFQELQKIEHLITSFSSPEEILPIKILGYGEMSLVFEMIDTDNLAFKRIPIFENENQIRHHIEVFKEYNTILNNKIGINALIVCILNSSVYVLSLIISFFVITSFAAILDVSFF